MLLNFFFSNSVLTGLFIIQASLVVHFSTLTIIKHVHNKIHDFKTFKAKSTRGAVNTILDPYIKIKIKTQKAIDKHTPESGLPVSGILRTYKSNFSSC